MMPATHRLTRPKGIGWDALDALEAAEEFFRGASLGIQGER